MKSKRCKGCEQSFSKPHAKDCPYGSPRFAKHKSRPVVDETVAQIKARRRRAGKRRSQKRWQE